MIHNGFDAEDLEGIQWGEQRRDKLCFVHCGQMYGTLRDLSPLFRALRELIDEGELDESRLELIYAGKDTSAFVDQATAAGLAGCLKGYGFMPRDESLKLQRSAHVLLLAAWNFKERQGNLPGKLLEYLMLDRPVLCCVAGELPDSEAAALIRQTKVGFCYENAHAADDFVKLKAYVLKLYQAFVKGEPLPFSPDEAELRRFAYRGVAEALETVLRG